MVNSQQQRKLRQLDDGHTSEEKPEIVSDGLDVGLEEYRPAADDSQIAAEQLGRW